MTFSQASFLFLYFPISTALYLAFSKWFGNNRASNLILVIIGLVFYWWTGPKSIGFFVTLTLLTYYMGRCISCSKTTVMRKKLLLSSIGILLIVFFIYKYLPCFFGTEGTRDPLFSEIIIPVSLSYFVLGAASYLVDIYRNEAQDGDLLSAFTYMTLYPKLLCGPIIKWKELESQITYRNISLEKIDDGITRIIIGLAKKVIIADTLSTQVVIINSKVLAVGADIQTMWLRALLIFFVIYCDFSGYSDIAIGLFKLLGFSVEENFDYPYLSTSLKNFWQRWHISLSRWIKDYIYIPLGGNRKGNIYINLWIAFFIAGVWHGSNLTILIWGAINGVLVVFERFVSKKTWYLAIPFWIKWIMTIFVVFMGWVLFMAPDLSTAMIFYKGMFIALADKPVNFEWSFYLTKRTTLLLIIAAIGSFGGFRRINMLLRHKMNNTSYYIVTRIALLLLFILDAICVFGTDCLPFIFSLL